MSQYSYDQMSNKVIRADRRLNDERSIAEPSSNPTSLVGQISIKDMGTRISNDKVTPPKQTKKKETISFNNYSYSSTFENISYNPTNEETAHIFDLIMIQVSHLLPDTSHDVVISASDSILEILKTDADMTLKRKELTQLLEFNIGDVELNDLANLANRITDYLVGPVEEDEDEGAGIAVVFDEDSEEEEEEDEVEDVEEETNEVHDDFSSTEKIITNSETSSKSQLIPLFDIDQFYIQRKLTQLYTSEDPSKIDLLNNECLRFLSDETLSVRDLENELMELFEYNHFEFVQLIMENRWRIAYRIAYVKAKDEESREVILSKMKLKKIEDLAPSSKRKLSDSEVVPVKKTKTEASPRQPQIVDLESLVFDQGSHLMTNTKVRLPPGSYQQTKKSYDIITIPPPSAPPVDDNERLVPITDMPAWARQAFPLGETLTLNRIQSKVYPLAFTSDENILLCAPTGAGKTNVAMLAALKIISNFRDETGKINLNNFKIVYIAPLKALVQEQMREFERRLTAPFGILVNELTGDSSLSKQQISETQVLVTTPEKWDVITRKPNEYVKLVRLVIIDEIHLLHDERGPVLESIIARTLRQVESTGEPVRLVGLSATLPNYKDVAQFLRVDFDKGLFYFDASYRPCPLEQQFIGIKEKKAIKKLNAMNEACLEKVVECMSNNHQLIIFVHSRKETFKTAKWIKEKLIEQGQLVLKSDGSKEILKQEGESMQNRDLQEIVPLGFGIHHAGLNKEERSVVEDLFAQGHLKVLVSTATLAWGVNLPAHTVVIKGTETYSPEKGTWVQLSPQDILQMLGRAGRPRYDKSGEGVIITSQDEIQYYLAILNQQLPIESQLMSKLADNLNAEMVLGSVTSREDAVKWLGYTYLYIRMLQSPALYHVGADYANDKSLVWKRTDLIHSALTILDQSKLVDYNPITGDIKSTELGKIASHYYISYSSMNMYNTKLKPWFTEIDILKLFAMSGEFKFIPVRQEEKLEISKLLEKCPYPIKESPNEPLAKVNVLLQTYISRLKLDGFALMADMIYITQSAGRLLRAIFEIAFKKNWSALAKIILNLCKMTEKRIWLTNSPFRQFGSVVPKDVIRATEGSHLPWISYFDLNASELAEALNFKGSSQVAYEFLQRFPKLNLSYYCQPITPTQLKIQVEIVPNWQWGPIHGNSEQFFVFVEDVDGEKLLYSDTLTIQRQYIGKEHFMEFTIPLLEPKPPTYYVTFISTKWLHSEWKIPLQLSDIKMPKKFPGHNELLQMQNVPTSSLQEEFAEVFDFTHFNKFQTQTFQTLYNSNESTFIGISKGGGKTVCAELAILNHWRQNKGRIVYLNPVQENVDKLTKAWSKKFKDITESGKEISKLTGDLTTDLGILGSSHLVLATPQQFNLITKRWRQRKLVHSIELLIADDAHTLDATYEVIVSRMRLLSAQFEISLRIVALASPISNGKDFGEWIGATKQHIFNFDPLHRFRKLNEIRLQGFDETSQMSTTALEYLKANRDQKSIVFISSRKAVVEFASLLLQQIDSLLKVELIEIKNYLDRIQDKTLVEFVSSGIGYLYGGMNSVDKLIVERLFENGVLSVLLLSKNACTYSPTAPIVVVLGNLEYDAREHRLVDYTIREVSEMIGTAQVEDSKVLLLLDNSKLYYYNKFVNEAFPIESSLNRSIEDFIIDEISARNFKNKQDLMDWITFTFFYRRLQLNPSYYDVKDTTHLGVSEYLSELIETSLKELEDAELVDIEEEDDEDEVITPVNSTMIASHYNVSFLSMKNFMKLNNKTRIRTILELLAFSAEFEHIPMRRGDDIFLRRFYEKLPVKLEQKPDFESPFTKSFILLQAHFSRLSLPQDLLLDQKFVLEKVLSLVSACIDILSSEGHLNAIQVMELSQMIVQGVWNNKESPLLQVPYFTDAILARCKKHDVETVYDIMSLEDDVRDEILQLDEEADAAKLNKIAEFVNKYPNIDIKYELDLSEPIIANEPKEILITLERDEDLEDLDIVSQQYPFKKSEGWWIVIGDVSKRQLYAIKKTTIANETQELKMEFTIPTLGNHNLAIWCMCDSYLDADKEVAFDVVVNEEE